jgi:hypothetical protein
LGRCLAGLNPNSEDFAILPLHFTVGNPMENARICETVELMYGPSLQKWAGTKDSDRAYNVGIARRVVADSRMVAPNC